MQKSLEQGQSRRRVEDGRFLNGAGRYVDDMQADGALHGVVLRSPHAHARIIGFDLSEAAAMPGVRLVLSAADLRAEGIGDLPCVAAVATVAPIIIPSRPALADGIVRHVGDPVAFVVADTAAQARDAAEAIAVDYEALPAVADAAAALAPDAPQLWPEAPGNLSYLFRKGDRAAVEAGFAAAHATVSLALVNNRVAAAPIEARAAIAYHDAASGDFLLELTGQGVHGIRDQLAQHILRIPPQRLTVMAPDVGGGFGAKNFVYPEYVLLLVAARRLARPVRWSSSRTEDFLSSAHGRDNRTEARMALDAEGRILALDVRTIANLGAYLSPSGPGSSTNAPGTAMGGFYAIPAVCMEVRGVFTNTVPIDAYRGAGKPEANYVTERLIDLAARQTRRDPAALRRLNLIADFPYRSAMGMAIDCGNAKGNLAAVLDAADQAGFAARRAAAEAQGKLRGFGLACFLETARGAPGEWAAVRFEADGQVALATGTQSNGQGHETSFPQIAADYLGLPHAAFRLVQADTRSVARGKGHGGARSLHMAGAALVQAMDAAIAKAKRLAAQLLQTEEASLEFRDGRFGVPGETRDIGLLDVARAAAEAGESIDAEIDSPLDLITFPNGCHVAEVEIDPETGLVRLLRYTAVDDYGTLVNPMLTRGQVQGGLAQGIGQALLEEVTYDADSAQPLAASFQDYCLPRAEDLPDLAVTFAGVPTASNPLGVKGSGQAGCIGAPQTVMHAVLDALAPLGVRTLDMPATPAKVWAAIQAARAGEHRSSR
ncbi:xanthine dehydrogenase family protein molybdopterin-binding subunit [Roseomonas hellenica]|uniref:Xanthine dehydrogenase family protein molybdopterin-binding subunit n=1 Tax=Plastoroseomonas hellenica TaxID=2687306 RepID=A0ABS5ER70_9PROT|nr:xanthine dehydrogenase family protein molybdopterin-binding subunit [Plastoroseomonas hellenica]MBR0662788.1 xanthine dehydrogenase family protein molybdopterin-binding subunit [Plastoroseomonas hellenica]